MTDASGRTATAHHPRHGGRGGANHSSRTSNVHSSARLELEPRHVDTLGLALLAPGLFMAGVGYLGWGGRRARPR